MRRNSLTPPMSERDFTWFGIFERAYIKPVTVGNNTVYAVHAANGALLLRLANGHAARLLVSEEFAMEAVSVH